MSGEGDKDVTALLKINAFNDNPLSHVHIKVNATGTQTPILQFFRKDSSTNWPYCVAIQSVLSKVSLYVVTYVLLHSLDGRDLDMMFGYFANMYCVDEGFEKIDLSSKKNSTWGNTILV